MVRPVGFGPVDVDLHRNPGRHRIGADEAPSSAENVELAVRDLRRVAQEHRRAHVTQGSWSVVVLESGPPPGGMPCTLARMFEFDLRNDVYRRPLATALQRVGVGPDWRCVDVGAGAGDVSTALATLVGRDGRIYAVDSDPRARDLVATSAAATGQAQVVAITQAGEDLALPEPVDLAFCRFLLMHVEKPARVLQKMASAVRPDGFVVAQEPITSAGRVNGIALSMPSARHPDIGAMLPSLIRDVGLLLIDAWAEAPADAGPGPVATYLASLTDVDPGEDSIVLPPLVTVIGQRRPT